ncbi:hypothetical protein F3Y22_tig00110301pilonHSYRG00018 [Hibiscus syriacus]|uniref:HMA domain-containing protein n=1 Tax=Hibiscus syriacus TaxID=106335 RepID=A0A6A3B2E3_HIBSY|nr:hypothetical protein F3Y22_tig00110301pilonHSYRG00018 [Hibiscus syriacus]
MEKNNGNRKVEIRKEGKWSLNRVETVKTESNTNKVTVIGAVDPTAIKDNIAKKSKKKVDFVAPQPKKDDNIEEKRRKNLTKTKPGLCYCVHELKVDTQKEMLTVKGTMDVKALAEALKDKLKKNVEIVPPKKEKDNNKEGGKTGAGSDGGNSGGGGSGVGGKKKNKGGNASVDGGNDDNANGNANANAGTADCGGGKNKKEGKRTELWSNLNMDMDTRLVTLDTCQVILDMGNRVMGTVTGTHTRMDMGIITRLRAQLSSFCSTTSPDV